MSEDNGNVSVLPEPNPELTRAANLSVNKVSDSEKSDFDDMIRGTDAYKSIKDMFSK